MKEQLDYDRRNKYLIDKLTSTEIDLVYLPLIASIISRRSEIFNFSDEYFIRDVDSFVNNVKTIEIGKLSKGIKDRFCIEQQKIVISSDVIDSNWGTYKKHKNYWKFRPYYTSRRIKSF